MDGLDVRQNVSINGNVKVGKIWYHRASDGSSTMDNVHTQSVTDNPSIDPVKDSMDSIYRSCPVSTRWQYRYEHKDIRAVDPGCLMMRYNPSNKTVACQGSSLLGINNVFVADANSLDPLKEYLHVYIVDSITNILNPSVPVAGIVPQIGDTNVMLVVDDLNAFGLSVVVAHETGHTMGLDQELDISADCNNMAADNPFRNLMCQSGGQKLRPDQCNQLSTGIKNFNLY